MSFLIKDNKILTSGGKPIVPKKKELGFADGTLTEYSGQDKKIRGCAFYNCSALTSINVPNATLIGTEAFRDCSALTSVDFPLVTSIGTSSFYNCRSLISVRVGDVKSIPTQTFYSCNNLKRLIILTTGSVPTLSNKNAFNGCVFLHGVVDGTYNPEGLKDGYIYVPRSMVDSYKSATNWSTFADQIRALEDYTVDGTTTGELDESKI